MKQKEYSVLVSILLLLVITVAAVSAGYFLYLKTSNILKDRLKERMIAIVSTAAVQFEISDINNVVSKNDVNSTSFIRLTHKLQIIRNSNNNVRFAYLLRPSLDGGSTYTFIADADSLDPSAEVDLNFDGVIDEEDELAYPGMEYDVSEIPSLIDAINRPTTDSEPIEDDWGTMFSAYAPIKDKGVTQAIIGIDVDVSDFMVVISETFYPFIVFLVFVLVILSFQTIALVSMWGSRVNVLKDLDRQKDELLGLVSHQLATPVSGLRWNLEMITDGDLGPLNAKQQEELRTMQGVVGNLSDLVSMILDVSRIQLGKMKVDRASIDLKQFFREITDVLAPRAHEKKIQFDVRVPENLGNGFIDKRLTHMTVENLISNAVKYTPENGKVSIDVSVQNGILKCIVQDTGCGIPKADHGKIFGKLYRASNVAAVDGNGFGLFVAKGAVEAQGGKIWFESEEGKGTKFCLELPLSKITT